MGKSASLKKIEGYLHPYPKVNGLDILHRHQGQYIYFSAWDHDTQYTQKVVKIHRLEVLFCKQDFYKVKVNDMEWLTHEKETI